MVDTSSASGSANAEIVDVKRGADSNRTVDYRSCW